MAKRRLPIIRIRIPKPEKPKTVGGGEIGSGYTPGVSDGSWLLPDWAREPLEEIEPRHWVPKRRD